MLLRGLVHPERSTLPGKTARAVAVVAVCAAAAVVGVPPVYACTPPGAGACADSSATVPLAASTLSLTAPASVTINGTFGVASSFSQQMGQVQVQDNRGSAAGWTLTALTSGNL